MSLAELKLQIQALSKIDKLWVVAPETTPPLWGTPPREGNRTAQN
jgi:hypothetical protein